MQTHKIMIRLFSIHRVVVSLCAACGARKMTAILILIKTTLNLKKKNNTYREEVYRTPSINYIQSIF